MVQYIIFTAINLILVISFLKYLSTTESLGRTMPSRFDKIMLTGVLLFLSLASIFGTAIFVFVGFVTFVYYYVFEVKK